MLLQEFMKYPQLKALMYPLEVSIGKVLVQKKDRKWLPESIIHPIKMLSLDRMKTLNSKIIENLL